MKMTTTIQETNDYDKAGRLSKEDELMMADPSRKEFCGVSVTADAIKVRTKVVGKRNFREQRREGNLVQIFRIDDCVGGFDLAI